MRRRGLRIAALAGFVVGAPTSAAATALSAAVAPALTSPALLQVVQFVHQGRLYCWYPYGWAGPGWYWCGYGTRFGVGWGGVYGWNGWVVPRSDRAPRLPPGGRFRRS
jgi:hypothetical protein